MHDRRMATDESEYWARRYDFDPPPTDRPSPGSQRWRPVLLADATDPGLVRRYERLRRELGRFACFRAQSVERLHVTVKMFDIDARGASRTDLDRTGLRLIDDALSETLPKWEPFEVAFPRLNLFPDVVYAEVKGDGELSALNRMLCDLPRTRELDRDGKNFIPHLTLGKLVGNEEYEDLVSFLEQNRDPGFPPVRIEALSLVGFDLSTAWPPTYRTIETYDLRSERD